MIAAARGCARSRRASPRCRCSAPPCSACWCRWCRTASARRLWLGALVDVVALVLYLLLVVLHDPSGFDEIVTGLYHGPSQILTFALPLVSPRTLLVGAGRADLAGRRGRRRVPRPAVGHRAALRRHAGRLRPGVRRDAARGGRRPPRPAARDAARRRRCSRAAADARGAGVGAAGRAAESTQADGVLPLRGLAGRRRDGGARRGRGRARRAGERVPEGAGHAAARSAVEPVATTDAVAVRRRLRPAIRRAPAARRVQTSTIDRPHPATSASPTSTSTTASGWSFDRTFRPSGGVLPGDSDPALRTGRHDGHPALHDPPGRSRPRRGCRRCTARSA